MVLENIVTFTLNVSMESPSSTLGTGLSLLPGWHGAVVPMVDTDGLETAAFRCIDGQVDIVIDAIKEDAHVNCLLEQSEFDTDHKLSMKEDVSSELKKYEETMDEV